MNAATASLYDCMWIRFYSLVLMKQGEGRMIIMLLKLWLQLSQGAGAISRLSTDVVRVLDRCKTYRFCIYTFSVSFHANNN